MRTAGSDKVSSIEAGVSRECQQEDVKQGTHKMLFKNVSFPHDEFIIVLKVRQVTLMISASGTNCSDIKIL
jgi:hypothetical protein